jgi:small subunit ribosomal protein S17
MADDEKTEIEETTPEVEGVSDAEVSDTVSEPEPETEAVADEPAAEAEDVSDTVPGSDTEPEPEVVSDEPAAEAAEAAPAAEEEAAPAAPVKKQRSLRHVPRSARRTRTKVKRETADPRKPITRIPKPESELGRRQERRGVVVSDKGEKTIIVKVDVIKLHPRYKKVVRRSVKFHAHDEQNTAGVGDTVRIIETRPLSKTKHWRLAEIVEKAK